MRQHLSNRVKILGIGIMMLLLAGCTPTAAPLPHWSAPTTGIAARAHMAGLKILGTEGTVMHIHTHLTITIDGQTVTVPAHIGIDTSTTPTQYAELHTHDTSGIIHVEAAEQKTFYLRQFFTEWGLALHPHGVGSYVNGKDGVRVNMYINQHIYTGDFTQIPLTNKTNLNIAITTNNTQPSPAPKFTWPSNY